MKFNALKKAFPYTIPVLTGYLFLGMAYGIYMTGSGFAPIYSTITSIIVFGGSLEFLIVSMFLAPFAPVQSFIMALMIQARHLFYGIAMLDKYKDFGLKKFYLIFGLSDETFSVNCGMDAPEDVDKGWFYTFVTLLDQSYWVIGSTTGALIGSMLSFNLTGLDFVMTAMFVVIFLEQWIKDKKHYSALIGVFGSIACRLVFGADNFLIPTMIVILMSLTLFRKPIEESLS